MASDCPEEGVCHLQRFGKAGKPTISRLLGTITNALFGIRIHPVVCLGLYL